MTLENLVSKLLQKPKFKKEFLKRDLAFDVAQMLIEARVIKGITQEDLAWKMKTHQSGIARAESGKALPSLSFLNKMAAAYKSSLVTPRFAFMKEYDFALNIHQRIEAQNEWFVFSPRIRELPARRSESRDVVILQMPNPARTVNL